MRPGGRSAQVREAVGRATRELLVEAGFSAITLPAVARRAGVHKTTVYRWWSSPLDLLHEAMADLEALALPDVDTGSWEGDIDVFIRSRVRLIEDPTAAALLRAVIVMRDPDPMLQEWVEEVWTPRRQQWRSPIERAIDRGELAASARSVPLVELVAGPLLLSRLAIGRRLSEAELEALAATVAAGIRSVHGIDA